jgi:cullin 3
MQLVRLNANHCKDRVYVKSVKVPSVSDMGIAVFRDTVLYASVATSSTSTSSAAGHSEHNQQTVCSRLCRIILNQITAERQGELIDRGVIKNITAMMHLLPLPLHPSEQHSKPNGMASVNTNTSNDKPSDSQPSSVYESDFEPAFLQTTAEFYSNESRQFLVANSVPSYLEQVCY